MAESDTARLGIRRWGAATDTPSRAEFDHNNEQLELLTAIDKQGTALPAPGVRGTYYYHETSGLLYRDNGVSWSVVGSATQDALVAASVPANVPLTVKGAAGQTANLFEVKDSAGADRFTVDKNGRVFTSSSLNGARLFITNDVASNTVMTGTGASGQTSDLLSLKAFDGSNRFKVTKDGNVESPFFRASLGSSVVNGSVASNIANHTIFSGPSALEIQSSKNGVGSFSDLIYLKHQTVDATAVARTLGLLMKVGDEGVNDQARSGGLIIESSQANFDNPQLSLLLGTSRVMTFPTSATGWGGIGRNMVVNAQLELAPTTGPALLLGNNRIGKHGADNMYLRTGDGFYWYRGGGHSDTVGDAGGGTRLMDLSSLGRLTVGKLSLTSGTDASLSTSDPMLMLGLATGQNLVLDSNEIQARANGAANDLILNNEGGLVEIGNDGLRVRGQIIADNVEGTVNAWTTGPGFSVLSFRAIKSAGIVITHIYVTLNFNINVTSGENIDDTYVGNIHAGWRPGTFFGILTGIWGDGWNDGEAQVSSSGDVHLRSAGTIQVPAGRNIRITLIYTTNN